MRIYLSSYRLGSHADVLSRVGGRALIVMNALDGYEQRMQSWDREVDDLARLGYQSEELDLRAYWGGSSGLVQRVAAVDLIWVVGGNAFVLARAATAARLAAALAVSPTITYAGYSAGACLSSVDLQGIDLMDEEQRRPRGYLPDMPAWTLQLTGTRIVPHAGTTEAHAAATYLRERGLDFVELADGEDMIVDVRL
jgi:dipeptidase E